MGNPAVAYGFDDIIVDPDAFAVEKSGKVLTLEPKSIRLLLYLIHNRARVIGKDELIGNVWAGTAVSDNSLARVVAQLRKGLGDDAKVARYIETVPTIGYRFIAEVIEVAPRASATAVPQTPSGAKTRSRLLALATGGLLLAILLGFSLWEGRPRPSPTWSGTVLGGPSIASHPRISPDGQLLAFRALIDGLTQVAVMKPDSSSWTALTNDRANGAVASLAWSRDGRKIYFDREWGPGRIYSIGALGGEPRLVLENAWQPEPLADGSLIAQRHMSDGREQVLRYWPDSGRVQTLPVTTKFRDSPTVRSFPDGREIAVFGLATGSAGASELLILNLESLEVRRLGTDAETGSLREPIAISRDGGSVLIQRLRNDTYETIAWPRSGSGAPQSLISTPEVASLLSEDVAADGSLYVDHSEFEHSVLLMNPAGAVQSEIPIPEHAQGNEAVVVLPEGGVVFDVRRQGRSQLFIGRAGAASQVFLNNGESCSLPATLLGEDKLAFILGLPDQPHIAIASRREGTVVHHFPSDAGQVTAMTAPADGHTIYYASNGTIWAQPVSGGDPRKISQGFDVAIDPSGKYLYLVRAGINGYELFHGLTAGGEVTRVTLPENVNLARLPLSSSAVDASNRILLPVNFLEVFNYRAAVFDPAHKTTSPVATMPRMVVLNSGWTRGGGISARIVRWSSSLWRYRDSVR